MKTNAKCILRKTSRLASVIMLFAMFSLLPTAAFAADAWEELFTADAPLSESQKDLLEQGMVQFDQGVTQNSYTITLKSGITDGLRAFLLFQVEGPVDTALDAGRCELLLETDMAFPESGEENYGISYHRGCAWEDDDPNDNSIYFLKEFGFLPPKDQRFSLADGQTWSVYVTGIQRSGDTANTMLVEGFWEFSVRFSQDSLMTNAVELLDAPVNCPAKRILGERSFDIQAKVTSVQLRPLSATLEVKRPFLGFWDGIRLEQPISFVLKDGSKIRARFQAYVNHGKYMEYLYSAELPVPVTEVVYVEFPDTYS